MMPSLPSATQAGSRLMRSPCSRARSRSIRSRQRLSRRASILNRALASRSKSRISWLVSSIRTQSRHGRLFQNICDSQLRHWRPYAGAALHFAGCWLSFVSLREFAPGGSFEETAVKRANSERQAAPQVPEGAGAFRPLTAPIYKRPSGPGLPPSTTVWGVYSLFPIPYSLLPTPYFLFPITV